MSAAVSVVERLGALVPEMIVFGGSVVVSVTGLSPRRSVRAATPLLAVITLVAALLALTKGWGGSTTAGLLLPGVGPFVRALILLMGIGGAALAAGLIDRRYEEAVARGVFGAPTFFVNGEMFFGQDRLDFVEEALIP